MKLIAKISQSAVGSIAVAVIFLVATVLMWIVMSADLFFAKIILTLMFVPLGLTFGLIGVMRLKNKKN